MALIAGLTMLLALVDMRYLSTLMTHDVYIYQCYARGFWQGAASVTAMPDLGACHAFWSQPAGPLHMVPSEYPAPSLAIFSLPLLLPGIPYVTGFVFCMAFILTGAAAAIARYAPPAASIAFLLYMFGAGYGVMLERFDLVPGLLILLALVLHDRRRDRAATVALALATALKGFPILLLPLLLIAIRRRDGRWPLDCLALFLATTALLFLPFAVLAGGHLLDPIRYELSRPLHSESASGLLYWVTGGLGNGVRTVYSFGSCNVVGSRQSVLTLPATGLLLLGTGYALLRQWRGRQSLAHGFMLIVLLTLVTSKVFSPQYLLWILPTVAVYEGIRLRWLLAAALTSAGFALSPLCWAYPTTLPHMFAAPHWSDSSTLVSLVLSARAITYGALALSYLRARGTLSPNTVCFSNDPLHARAWRP
jgi:uncharacterized membrane protein